jgi:5-methylcytosine-specific restriction endonuclease McrA
MAQGRVKRLQSESRAQSERFKQAEAAICALCARPIPPALRDAHHLIPKSRGGVLTVFMHRACHKQVHALFTETELAQQ